MNFADSPKKFLILRFSSIGDIIMTTPVVRCLKQQVPGAVVHLSDTGAVEAEDLIAFLHQHIAAFKVPRRIWIAADPLPRLGTEKIDKVSLKAKYRAVAAGD